MKFFKIIKDNKVVDIGVYFLRWCEENNDFIGCDDLDKAEFAQSLDDAKVYHPYWLKRSEAPKDRYELADVDIIEEAEFRELEALINEGKPIPQKEEVVEEVLQQQEETIEEKPMSIPEMRKRIDELTAIVEQLLKKDADAT